MPTHRVVKIDELSQYFHLPEKAVARQLGVCLTSLKKICRQNGITRWPYRKLKSLDKKIHKIENALTSTTEDPSAMIMKWETLKLEKKNLPFAGNSDDSDSETKKRSSPVENAARAAPNASAGSSFTSDDKVYPLPEWNPAPSSASAASGATTPGTGVPQRCLHTMLEQKLRQVGCVAAHREALVARQAQMQNAPARVERPAVVRPDDIEIMDEPLISGPMTDDFYGRSGFDSSRGLSARGVADLDSFKMPMFSPSGEISIHDLFPEQSADAMGSAVGVSDLVFSEDFSMLSALS